jgi:hypothetical protein
MRARARNRIAKVRAHAEAGIAARALGAPGAFGNVRCYPVVPRAGARGSLSVMDNTLKGLGGCMTSPGGIPRSGSPTRGFPIPKRSSATGHMLASQSWLSIHFFASQ